ncbi:chitin synthase [Dichomitus squalens LYAD-421 SS1]|uniref:Chitin synthase n=1 Tax=Dichomitus squalens TaxID=114155 RepID=A0A4Q9Q5C6_9APHY|nr:chitin synthase [Dichomitus squalens LYAD-421 SS1]EJF67235.1 chitin synthase [Dichomitus squalens LYAD-421 SS1]TBU29869.1 chitin synthase [Dichomitus squalens]TBU62613.1 chitin synthase [Dichomitus squalens]
MSYHQQIPQHDPYANAYPDYPPAAPQPHNAYNNNPTAHLAQQAMQQDYSFDQHSNWDAKSYNSSYAGSQAHLNPHEMSQVHAPPMPTMPYQGMGNYPPQQRPGMLREQSSGYSVARDKLMKRRSVRHVELQQGNLVLDMQVPSHIVPKGMEKAEEMTKLRYTAATCDPDDFMRNKYTLRPYLMGRRTELFIVMTMYNEDEVLFVRTMNAYFAECKPSFSVLKNIAHLCSRTKSKTWGPDGWKKVVVCVVSDGRSKINKRTLQVLTLMGCYQEGIAKDSIGGKDVTAHIFEYTSNVIVTERGEVSQSACPVQIIFCLKEQNKKKLNSHRWFFNAFGPLIQPNVCVLLDVGTKPTGTSIYELWKCFDKHSGVGGACGEICVDTGKGCSLLLTSPLAASQNFEYKMSNILDKPLESVFGYISVLPGAFSAYRYKALQNGPDGKGPLASYFKGETMHGAGSDAGLFERNMYLAEDRILCFEIVTKKRESWVLKYVKSAKASTDVPTTVPEFISQRRRWLNGSLFASVHATVFWWRIWTSGQGFFRKILLQLEFIYNAIQLVFTWTSLANFYLAFFFLVSSATSDVNTDAFKFLAKGAGPDVFEVFLKLYLGLLFIILVCSLGNRPQGSKWTYTVCIVLFGLCNVITLWCAGYTVYLAVPHTVAGWKDFPHLVETNATFRDIVISLAATYGLYFVASFMHFEPWHMFTSFLQYMFWLPSYVNILMMYAMCNLHDVTWGTKGDNGSAKDLGGAKKVNKDGKEVMEVELPTAREDVDQVWQASRTALSFKPPEEKEHRDAATKQADHDRNSRTNVVLAWVGTNILMILVFTSSAFTKFVNDHVQSTQGAAFNPYLTFLFWALAGLSAIRFFGSFSYLLLRLVGL